MATRSGDLKINKTKPCIYGYLLAPVRGSKADAKRSTLHATTHEPIRRLVNSAEREDVGDDHAVAMGFKEVEPVDFLAGTCLVRFPSGAAPSRRPQMSRASRLDEWDTKTGARN
jgi:hypothetical protein